MKTSETPNGDQALDLTLAQPKNGDGVSTTQEAFAGMFQAGYEAGYGNGHDGGYRQGFDAGYAAARQHVSDAPPADEKLQTAKRKARLFGLPCNRCHRFLYSDEERCPYCKAPKATPEEPAFATRVDQGEVRKREANGGNGAAIRDSQ